MNHHFYFTNPSVSSDGDSGYFVSYRTGYPNLFSIDLESGSITCLTRRIDINPFSPVISPDGGFIYFSAPERVFRLAIDSGISEVLAHFSGGRLGNCVLSNDGSELAIAIRREGYSELAVIATDSGNIELVVRGEEIGHVQFCPADPALLLFSGTTRKRLWCHDRGTGETWRPLAEKGDEWFIHESWLGQEKKILFVRWPSSLLSVGPRGEGLRELLQMNAWHPRSDREGNRVVFDTNHPDQGIILLDMRSGKTETLCMAGATQRGYQWACSLPADSEGIDISIFRSGNKESYVPPAPEDPETLYGPQWSHPHPTFSPDGKAVVFTSDRDGYSHIYSLSPPMTIT